MSRLCSFTELIDLVCAGNQEAATELVRRHGPHLLGVIHTRLAHSLLRRSLKDEDIADWVWSDFFRGEIRGQFDLRAEEDLDRLLTTIADHRVAAEWRRRGKDLGIVRTGLQVRLERVPAPGSPEEDLQFTELLERIRSRCSDREFEILLLHLSGKSWKEIGKALGMSANAARMEFVRFRDRMRLELKAWISDQP